MNLIPPGSTGRIGHILVTAGSLANSIGSKLLSGHLDEMAAELERARAHVVAAYHLGRLHEHEGHPALSAADIPAHVATVVHGTLGDDLARSDAGEHQDQKDPGEVDVDDVHPPQAPNLRPVAIMNPDGSDTGRTVWETAEQTATHVAAWAAATGYDPAAGDVDEHQDQDQAAAADYSSEADPR